MPMIHNIKVDFFVESKKWSNITTRLKKISNKSIINMSSYFDKNTYYNINIILSDKNKVTELNRKYKKNTKILMF